MIKLMGDCEAQGVWLIYADTKEEVPETVSGILAVVEKGNFSQFGNTIAAGSIIYTAKAETAIVKSDGTIEWGE